MAWYDIFAELYDPAIEALYVAHRGLAADALAIQPGQRVLDIPVGTGQNLAPLRAAVGDDGVVVGVDYSPGMLKKAGRRVARGGWSNVSLKHGDVQAVSLRSLGLVDGASVDGVLVFLGMSVFPDDAAAFEQLWGLLRAGGRMVLVDVYAKKPGLQGRFVQVVARADLTRRPWLHLRSRCVEYERRVLSSDWRHGGELWLASGVKPG